MKTKKRLTRLFASLLLFAMLICLLSGCGQKRGKAVMWMGNTSISANHYQLFLSRMKGSLARYSEFGVDATSPAFWDTYIQLDGNKTYNDYYTEETIRSTKLYLIALYLFDQYGLSLPESTVKEIDKEMENLITGDGNGSKAVLNDTLAQFGVNYEMLREAYLMDAKITALQNYLYGADGSKIGDTVKEEYMRKYYVCYKQIFMATYYYVYETDAYGNTVYYSEDNKYLYDTVNGTPRKDDEGNLIKDKFGNPIYYDEEGKILYDKEKGLKNPLTDENGDQIMKEYSKEEIETIKKNIETLEAQIEKGDTKDFESMMETYSQDYAAMEEYPEGYYLSTTRSYELEYLTAVTSALSEMEVGETRLISLDGGFYLIMKYECQTGAYNKSENAVWFQQFASEIIEYMFSNEMEKYMDQIQVDEEELKKYDIKSAAINFWY